jgi:hypothetical protein
VVRVRKKIFSFGNVEVSKCSHSEIRFDKCYEMTIYEPESEKKVYSLQVFKYEISARFKRK